MMTRKTLTALALSFCLGVSFAARADEEQHLDDKKSDKSAVRSVKEDKEITSKTAELGQKLFFGTSDNKSAFKEYYDKVKFPESIDGDPVRNLVEGINKVKPWKEGDENPTVEQEMPNAMAIATMFDEMNDKDAPGVVKGIWDAYKKVSEKATGDTQYDEVVKRLWAAAQLKVPNNLWPEKPPKQTAEERDPRLAKFREAFLAARDERLKFAQEFKDKVASAASGNKAAQADLFGSKTDKENPAANKFAVGANINNYIRKMFADGNTNGALDMIRALSVNNKMYYNNADGKMVSMSLPTVEAKNAGQLKNIFNDSKMVASQFVGHEADAKSEIKPVDWMWDTVTKSVIPRGDAKPTPAAATGAAPPVPADVAAVVSSNCKVCHTTSVNGNQIIGKGGKAGSRGTNWEKMIAGANLSADQATAFRNYVSQL